MKDIAHWLLMYAQQFEDQHAPQNMTIGMREAAAEIERLRAALGVKCGCPSESPEGQHFTDCPYLLALEAPRRMEMMAAKDAEIERLAGELTDAETDAVHDRQQIRENAASITALQAENAKLRAAISWIAPPFVDEATPEAELRQRIAFAVADMTRAALGGENG